MAGQPDEAQFIVSQISSRIGYLQVMVTRPGEELPHRCEEVVQAQQSGEDPTASWRHQVSARQESYAGQPVPPQVAAAFVMQWYLGVIAVPLAWAAVLSTWVLDGSPDALSYDLAPSDLYPDTIGLRLGKAVRVPEESERLALARNRYQEHAQCFADHYRPTEVRMGSGRRNGLVHDAWTMALEDARAAVHPGPRPTGRSRRRGCCMIYLLPGAHECEICPRGRRAPETLSPRRTPSGHRPD